MTEIQRAAEIHWRMLNDQPVAREEFSFCMRFVMGDHHGSAYHILTRDLPEQISHSLFQQQVNTAQLISEWHSALIAPEALSAQDAMKFLIAIYNSLEEVDAVFTNHITPGVTRNKRGEISDLITKRPNIKLGWSLQLTTEGTGRYNCVRTTLNTQPGDLVLLSPDALYDYGRHKDCALWEHQWVYFPQEEQWLKLLEWPESGPNIYHLATKGEDFSTLKTLFDQIITAQYSDSHLSDALIHNLLEQVLIRCRQLAPEHSLEAIDKRVRRAMDYIAQHFDQTFSIDFLAGEIGLSSARLSTLFKQQTGSTIIRWRDERRMSRACQLLVQTPDAVNKISETVGYSDPLYFTRCFRQHMDCSPRDYRKKRRGL